MFTIVMTATTLFAYATLRSHFREVKAERNGDMCWY